jgi:lysophospholipase L1-like esterase
MTSEEPKPKRSLRKRLAGVALKLCLVVLFMECALRAGAWFAYGQNPYYLFYGFQGAVSQVNVSPWSVYAGQYYKYPPSYALQGAAGQHGETAHTNSLGFRGRDFTPEKPAGAYRVFCTGGSSTFGFHNDDDETYPHYTQQLLAEDEATQHVEVLNAGFPYYNTATIRGLLEDELVRYAPDLVTVYTGYNDTSWPLEIGPWFRTVNWLQETSITCFVLKQTILTDKNIYSWFGRFTSREGGSIDRAWLEDDIERTAARFRANLEAMLALSRSEGFELLLIRQPITTVTTNKSFKGRTYEQEYEGVMAKLEAGDWVSRFDLSMIRHHRLIEELDALAEREGLPVIDNIALLDQHRELLASWVHLEPEANRMLAAALADSVRALATR